MFFTIVASLAFAMAVVGILWIFFLSYQLKTLKLLFDCSVEREVKNTALIFDQFGNHERKIIALREKVASNEKLSENIVKRLDKNKDRGEWK